MQNMRSSYAGLLMRIQITMRIAYSINFQKYSSILTSSSNMIDLIRGHTDAYAVISLNPIWRPVGIAY